MQNKNTIMPMPLTALNIKQQQFLKVAVDYLEDAMNSDALSLEKDRASGWLIIAQLYRIQIELMRNPHTALTTNYQVEWVLKGLGDLVRTTMEVGADPTYLLAEYKKLNDLNYTHGTDFRSLGTPCSHTFIFY